MYFTHWLFHRFLSVLFVSYKVAWVDIPYMLNLVTLSVLDLLIRLSKISLITPFRFARYFVLNMANVIFMTLFRGQFFFWAARLYYFFSLIMYLVCYLLVLSFFQQLFSLSVLVTFALAMFLLSFWLSEILKFMDWHDMLDINFMLMSVALLFYLFDSDFEFTSSALQVEEQFRADRLSEHDFAFGPIETLFIL